MTLSPSRSSCKVFSVHVYGSLCVCVYLQPKVESMKIATPTLLVRQLDPCFPRFRFSPSSSPAHKHTCTENRLHCQRLSLLSLPLFHHPPTLPVAFIAVQFVVEIVLSDS